MMDIIEWADKVLLNNPQFTYCYIAIVENDNQYALEIELDASTIAGCYSGIDNFMAAWKLAIQLDDYLTKHAIKVFKTRIQWEGFLFDGLSLRSLDKAQEEEAQQ